MATFIGRRSELQKLAEKLTRYDIIVIHGLKGIGKTSLAREYCKGANRPYLWIDLRNITNSEEVLYSLARHCLQEEVIADDTRALLSALCENIVRRKHCIIVFDNAEDVFKDEDNLSVEILLSLSQLKNTKIIVTSTIRVSSEKVQLDELLLKELSYEDSFDLLKTICPSLKDTDKISKIVELCEGLPLALLLAGGEVEDDSNLLDAEDVIYFLSHQRIRILSSEFYTQDEQIDSIYKGFLDRLPKLLGENLANVNYIPGTFDLKEALDILGVRSRFCKTFSDILKEIEQKTYTKDYADALCRLNVEHRNFGKLFSDVIYCTEDTYHVFIDLAATTIGGGSIMFRSMATYNVGVEFYEKCLQKAQEFRQELDEAKVLTGYGRVLTNIKGDCVKAEEKFQKAMAIRRQHPDKRDYFLALLCQSYGWNLGSQGKFVDAIRILEEAFQVERELKMYYENLILQTMQSLAIFLNMSDNIEKGEPFQQEVLKRRRHVIGTDNHPIIGSIMNNMGVMYERKKDFRKAAEYYRNGLKIKEETNAPLKAIIISETNVARSLLESGQAEEAIILLENSFKRLDDFPSLFSDAKSLLWEAMGNAFIKLNNFEEAAESFKKAIEYRSHSSAMDHSILGLVCLYAKSLLALAEYEKAIKEIKKGLCLCDLIIKNNPTNPTIILTYEKLMEAQFALKRRKDLEKTYEGGIAEFYRLIKVYENLKNFNKRQDVLDHLRKFKARYAEMLAQLNGEIPVEGCTNNIVTVVSFCTLRVICVVFLYVCMKIKEQ
ncbi:uncharacterized protein LOC134278901 isoform X2 [Saccostrea cucullata]|uniref:uncharacterized protein LOC134278901 isoform X2 n=1 Tax=Saccostrea cuccullata TaxID=36930 RepID=UPI002ED47E84